MSRLQWKKAAAAVLSAAAVLQSGFFMTAGHVLAQEETEVLELQELTAPELQTEEGSASFARLRIGDWLDYGDYEIERADIPGTDYLFYITTQAADGTVINDDQLAYCVQSYFLTPLPGDHSADMTDQVSAVGNEKNLQKVIYYGYGGAGYQADEFVEFLVKSDAEYYENVYTGLSESGQSKLCYILTHAAASYAYFMDGTSLEEYLRLQFQIKYGENWEEELNCFTEQELEKAKITDGDMNLFGATYGMNPEGIALAKGWYQLLSGKKAPELSITVEDGFYTFNGNETNRELELTFEVPDGFYCTVIRGGGGTEDLPEGTEVVVLPSESFAFTFADEAVSSETGGISELAVPVEGTLSGTGNEAWNLILLQTNKGTNETISKRQQDIAAVSMLDAGRTELDFEIEMLKGSVSVSLADDGDQAVQGAEFGVYYDAACSKPVQQDGENVRMVTDALGEAYLEFVINQELQENGGKLYVKMLEVPTGYLMDEEVHCIEIDRSASSTAERETTSVSGAVSWKVPENTELPEEISAELQRDGEVIDTKVVTEEEGWKYEWDHLPKYRTEADGGAAEYDYSVAIAPVEGYDTVIDGYDAVNTITGEISMEGQIIWNDHDDADGLRPESITVNLYRDESLIDSVTAGEEDGWRYSFGDLDKYSEDGKGEYIYKIDAEAPKGYTLEIDGDQIAGTHTASASVDIEGVVNLNGRNLADGEFSFDLAQVTDETGKNEVENGTHITAFNDADGRVTFPDIICTEPGTYYYRITETPVQADGEEASVQTDNEEAPEVSEYIAKIEVTAGGENMDQLEAVVTYPNGQPEFEYVYTASGEAVLDDILIVLENGTLAEGAFHVELKDREGKVLQTGTNDADGKVAFEPLKFTQEDIGEEYVYTVSEVNDGAADITYDPAVYTVTVKIEDSGNRDGMLRITQEAENMTFTNIAAEPETELETETETETEVRDKEGESETGTEIQSESSEPDTRAGAETENTEKAEAGRGIVIPLLILVIVLVCIVLFRKTGHRKQ